MKHEMILFAEAIILSVFVFGGMTVIHESVHVYQFNQAGFEIKEVCLIGHKVVDGEDVWGWVDADGEMDMVGPEIEAHLIGYFAAGIMVALGSMMIIERYIRNKEMVEWWNRNRLKMPIPKQKK